MIRNPNVKFTFGLKLSVVKFLTNSKETTVNPVIFFKSVNKNNFFFKIIT